MSDETTSNREARREELASREQGLGSVIRHAEHPEWRSAARDQWRAYFLSLLLVGIAGLIVIWQIAQRPSRPTPGVENKDLPVPEKAQGALVLMKEADTLFASAKTWYWDDDAKIAAALNKYLEAWKLLHGGAEFPEGKLIYDSATCGVAERDLGNVIPRCKGELGLK